MFFIEKAVSLEATHEVFLASFSAPVILPRMAGSRKQSEELLFLTSKIAELRDHMGISQERLREMVFEADGEGCASVSSIENGYSRVTVQTLLTLAEIFRVPLDVFQKNKKSKFSRYTFVLENDDFLRDLETIKGSIGEKATLRILCSIGSAIAKEHRDVYRAQRDYEQMERGGKPLLIDDWRLLGPKRYFL